MLNVETAQFDLCAVSVFNCEIPEENVYIETKEFKSFSPMEYNYFITTGTK